MRGSARSVPGKEKREASRKLRRRREREAKKARRTAAQKKGESGTKREAVSSSNRSLGTFRGRASILLRRDVSGSTEGKPEVTNL